MVRSRSSRHCTVLNWGRALCRASATAWAFGNPTASPSSRWRVVTGAGTPTDQYATNATVTNADCRWGATDGRGNAVNARISIWARQEAADAQWQTLSIGQAKALPVGDEAFVTDEGSAVVVRVRAGNAVATVRLIASADATGQAPLTEAAGDITDDMLDDLVPG